MEAPEGITTSYSNKAWDLINADRIYRASISPRQKIAAVIMSGFGIYALCTNAKEYWWISALVFALATAVWFGVRSWQFDRVYHRIRKDPWLLGPYVITISDDGIYLSRVVGKDGIPKKDGDTLEWSQFSRAFETGKTFILIRNGQTHPVIPKHAFESKDEVGKVRELLKRNIGKKPAAG